MTAFLGIEPSDLEEVDVLMAIAVASTIPTKLEACACYVVRHNSGGAFAVATFHRSRLTRDKASRRLSLSLL